MSKVTVSLNGRPYTVGCEPGQEDHLMRLAAHLDRHVLDLVERVGQVGEVRLFLMASLMVADELSENLTKLDALRAEVTDLRAQRDELSDRYAALEDRAARLMTEAARKIEDAARSDSAHG